jgi:hypothetical protein
MKHFKVYIILWHPLPPRSFKQERARFPSKLARAGRTFLAGLFVIILFDTSLFFSLKYILPTIRNGKNNRLSWGYLSRRSIVSYLYSFIYYLQFTRSRIGRTDGRLVVIYKAYSYRKVCAEILETIFVLFALVTYE